MKIIFEIIKSFIKLSLLSKTFVVKIKCSVDNKVLLKDQFLATRSLWLILNILNIIYEYHVPSCIGL